MVPNWWPESSKFEIQHGSVNHLPKIPVNHKTWLTAFSAWLTQGPSTIKHPSTITIPESAEPQIHTKTNPWIMETILQDIREVFIRAAGFRGAYWIYIHIHICIYIYTYRLYAYIEYIYIYIYTHLYVLSLWSGFLGLGGNTPLWLQRQCRQ